MSRELDIVQHTKSPITKRQIIQDLQALGLNHGDTVIVHSSLSQMGWIPGGAVTVINALLELLSPDGTLVMPSQSSGNSEPRNWHHPPVPEEWWPIIRDQMPPYDPCKTPTQGVGIIPEVFRGYPEVFRSDHPQCSFLAWGAQAEYLTQGHTLTPIFGKSSPLGKIYEMGGKILLLGVDHDSNTSLHLAESLANIPNHPHEHQGAAIMRDDKRQWVKFDDIEYDEDDFMQMGLEYEQKTQCQSQLIGNAPSKLFQARELIEFAVPWFKNHRSYEK